MELFADQSDATKAVGTIGAIHTANEIITLHATNAVLKLAALVTLSTAADMGAIRAAQRVRCIVTTMAITTVCAKHALAAIIAAVGVEALRISAFFALIKKATIFFFEGTHVHGAAYYLTSKRLGSPSGIAPRSHRKVCCNHGWIQDIGDEEQRSF